MNYDTYDCRLNLSAEQAAKLLRRKAAKKPRRTARGENRVLAAIRAVTATVALFLAGTVMAQAQFVIQPANEAASKDTKIYASLPTGNFSSTLNIAGPETGANFLALVQIDLATLPYSSGEITSAIFSLYCTGLGPTVGTPGVGAGEVTLSPILTNWRENGSDSGTAPLATYDNFFGASPTLSFGAAVATQNVTGEGYVNWDITNLVKEWVSGARPNYGVFIQTTNPLGDIGFADTDSPSAGFGPKLTVVPEPSSAILALAGGAACLLRRRRQNAR